LAKAAKGDHVKSKTATALKIDFLRACKATTIIFSSHNAVSWRNWRILANHSWLTDA
jgi:hypothetical protein